MGILNDIDPVATREWVDSLKAVLHYRRPEREQHPLGSLAVGAVGRGRGGAPPSEASV